MEKILKEIKKLSGFIHEKGWSCGSEGNLSVIIDRIKVKISKLRELEIFLNVSDLNGKSVLITSKGVRIRDLRKNPERNLSLLKICKDKVYLIKGREPSTEIRVHLLCYREILKNRLKDKFLLHVHPENIVAISHFVEDEKDLNKILENIHFEFKYLFPEGVGFISEKKAGSIELAEETAEKIRRYECVIWKKHGIIARGKSFEECFDRIEIIEKLSGIYFKILLNSHQTF